MILKRNYHYHWLLKRKKAVIAIEWSIVAPFIFLLTFFSIMFAIFCLDYYTLSHTAFSIAQELNMGDEGYRQAAKLGENYCYKDLNPYLSKSNKQWGSNKYGKDNWEDVWDPDSGKYGMFVPQYLGDKNIKMEFTESQLLFYEGTDEDEEVEVFESAARYFIFNRALDGGFDVPYTTIEKIRAEVCYRTELKEGRERAKPKIGRAHV